MRNQHSLDKHQQAKMLAYQIMSGFDRSYRRYSRITAGAQERFEKSEWAASAQAIKDRITIYHQSLTEIVTEIYQNIHPETLPDSFWWSTKTQYTNLLKDHPQFELAETFYNSVIGRIYRHVKFDNQMMYVLPSRCHLPGPDRYKVVNSFDTTGTVRAMFEAIFDVYRFKVNFDNFELDISNLDAALRQRLNQQQLSSVQTIEMLKSVFYRGKAAYLVGRICMPGETLPFVIALHMSDSNTLIVDALLTERPHMSVIFGFARSYFMAETQHPAEVVAFLQELLPHKKNFELYTSLGFYKHGKTVFFRNYLEHLEASTDKFELAPGIKGLVMAVFHLPSYGVVFKLIRDEFAESKKITREHVKDCYRLVKMTDRVGRMADTHEYVNFLFPKARFDETLLEHLLETCASSVSIQDDYICIKHMYIERKMTPLNLYLRDETDQDKIKDAVKDLGLCIKQIALANIFPGDMLHKNFGITKTGRVIFYDYDEICYMNERTFRELPKSDDPYALDTLSVGPSDVFPEQFEHFILGKKHLKDLLKEYHGDLMTPQYWKELQKVAAQGIIQNFTPYPEHIRFRQASAAS
ncbi:bifunctional isocitrate dehydrogenase kinase/phosphatase [Glaciecola sp. SC05]|uniref:bifunctional isocitrate dehydrogenase kinase/phosphatase n=1 Tax=Glaciecola sp. SC05 TaxID=1987355 RepID=UPI003529B65F